VALPEGVVAMGCFVLLWGDRQDRARYGLIGVLCLALGFAGGCFAARAMEDEPPLPGPVGAVGSSEASRTGRLEPRSWTAQGADRSDRGLVRDAVRTWSECGRRDEDRHWHDRCSRVDPAEGYLRMQLLFAQRVSGVDVVALLIEDDLVRYVAKDGRTGLSMTPLPEQHGTGTELGAPFSVFDYDLSEEGDALSGLSAALDDDIIGRLVVPPWLTDLAVSPVGEQGEEVPGWTPLAVRDGLSVAAVPRYGTCLPYDHDSRAGALVRGRLRDEEGTTTQVMYADATPHLTRLSYWTAEGGEKPAGWDAFDRPYVRSLVGTMSCDPAGDRRGTVEELPRTEVHWTELWKGRRSGKDRVIVERGTQYSAAEVYDQMAWYVTLPEERQDTLLYNEFGADRGERPLWAYHVEEERFDTPICGRVGKEVLLAAPPGTTRVRLTELASGRTWSGDGNFLAVRAGKGSSMGAAVESSAPTWMGSPCR
jgi:hypothetical protein